MAEQQELTVFISDLSPFQYGASKNYNDFSLQTDDSTSVRGACFSPQKRKLFADAEENQERLIKIQKG